MKPEHRAKWLGKAVQQTQAPKGGGRLCPARRPHGTMGLCVHLDLEFQRGALKFQRARLNFKGGLRNFKGSL